MLENWEHFHWVSEELGAGLRLGGATVSEDYGKRDVG